MTRSPAGADLAFGDATHGEPGDSAHRYRAIFETSREGLFIADVEGRILEANPAFAAMHGQGEVVGTLVHDVCPELRQLMASASVGLRPARTRHRRADGTTFEAEVTCRPIQYGARMATLGAVRDITRQARIEQVLEDRVAERTRELESLLQVARAVTSTLDLRELVRLVLTELRAVIDYSAASLILIEGDELVVHDLVVDPERAGKGTPQTGARFRIAELTAKTHATEVHPSTLDYPCVQVAASQDFWDDIGRAQTVVIEDVLTSGGAIANSYREAMGHLLHTEAFAFIRTWMAVPLMVKGAPIGYFGVANDTPHCFTDKQVTIAKAFADHASVAIENARLYEQAHALAVLEERQRLARDLHDSVAQAMYGVALGARAARKYLDKDVEAIEPMDYVISLAAAGLAEMRALIFDLHPGAIAEEGIVNAVKRQVTAAEARHGLSVDFNAVEPEADLKAKETVYSVVREALHNVVKHAQASTVTIAINSVNGRLNFSVIDDGIGFDPAATGPGHMGLQSMRERVERMAGTISIESVLGHGSKVAGSLPR